MRRILGMAVGFCFLTLLPAHAIFCRTCGMNLPEHSKFCNSCGTAQNADIAPPLIRQEGSPPRQRPAAMGAVSNQQFFRLVKPLEDYEEELRISNLGSPLVPSVIQRTLIPGYETIRRNLSQRRLALSPVQNRILTLYIDHYNSILAWATTLGSEKEMLFPRIGQTMCLQAFLTAHPDDDGLAAAGEIEKVFATEQKNLVERNDNLKENAGFENPGLAYQIRSFDKKSTSDSFTFTLLMYPKDRKIGERIHVFDRSHARLGQMDFVEEKDGIRRYVGTMSRKQFAALTSRQVQLEYVVKTTFSTSWKKENLRLLLLSSLKANDSIAFEYEAFHGTNPEFSRMRFLQSIGKY